MKKINFLFGNKKYEIDAHSTTKNSLYDEEGNFLANKKTYSDEDIRNLEIPCGELDELDSLVNSGVLNSDKVKNEIIRFCNFIRNASGENALEEKEFHNDVDIYEIIIFRENCKKDKYFGKIKIGLIGDINETDPDHGISITFVGDRIVDIGSAQCFGKLLDEN